jgi:hypothetical protein
MCWQAGRRWPKSVILATQESGWKPAWANSSQDSISKIPNTKKRAGRALVDLGWTFTWRALGRKGPTFLKRAAAYGAILWSAALFVCKYLMCGELGGNRSLSGCSVAGLCGLAPPQDIRVSEALKQATLWCVPVGLFCFCGVCFFSGLNCVRIQSDDAYFPIYISLLTLCGTQTHTYTM